MTSGPTAKKLIALDAIRGAAALYVIAHHLAGIFPLPGLLSFALHFGQEAVIVFFLLSGFVIHLSVDPQRDTLRTYLIKRIRRIYPLFLVALFISWLIAGDSRYFSWWPLIGNLALLHDLDFIKPGVIVGPFLGNLPLWSLSYEWWFYLSYVPLIWLVKEVNQRHVVGVISHVAGITYLVIPNAPSLWLTYLVIWWAGVELAREYRTNGTLTMRKQWPLLIWLGSVTLSWAILAWILPKPSSTSPGMHPWVQLRHLGTAIILLAALLAWHSRPNDWRVSWLSNRAFSPVVSLTAMIGTISYALYIFHYPLLIQWQPDGSPWVVWPGKFLLLITLSVVLERWLQPWIATMTQPLIRRWARAKPSVGFNDSLASPVPSPL